MKLMLVACCVAAMATYVCGGLTLEKTATLEESIVSKEAYESSNPDYDYNSLQQTKLSSGEIEGDDIRDEDFDNEVTDEEERPAPPTQEEAQEMIAAVSSAARVDSRTVSSSQEKGMVYYVPKPIWYKMLKCCPRHWGYGCRHVNQRMPCFVNYSGWLRQWCCPIWPRVYVANCLCHNCAIQTSTCIHQGKCNRRYRKQTFWAVCYRFKWFPVLKPFTKWIPSSCYCNARSTKSAESCKA